MDTEVSDGTQVEATSAIPKIITTGFRAIQLIYFFTAGEDEVKCWQIRKATKAPQVGPRIEAASLCCGVGNIGNPHADVNVSTGSATRVLGIVISVLSAELALRYSCMTCPPLVTQSCVVKHDGGLNNRPSSLTEVRLNAAVTRRLLAQYTLILSAVSFARKSCTTRS